MSGQNTIQTISLPPVHHYDVIYEDLVHDLAILMARDQREHWTPMLTVDADETINQPKLDYLKEHIAALEDEYLILYQTSNELTATGKSWMTDAAKHPADVCEAQLARHKKLLEDHGVPTLESNARDKLAEFRDEINRQKEVYRAAKDILSQTGGIDTSNSSNNTFPNATEAFGATSAAGSNRRPGAASFNARNQSDQPNFAAEVNFQDFFTERDEVRGSDDAAPDQPDQFNVVADANLQDPLTKSGEVRDLTDASLDPERRAVPTFHKWELKTRLVKENKLQSVKRIENYLSKTEAPLSLRDIDLHSGSFPTVRRLFEFVYRRLQPSNKLPAFNNQQDFAQYFADVLVMLGYPTPLTKVQVQIMTAPHVWPCILSALEWLVCLQPIVEANSEVTSPSHPAPDSDNVRQLSNDTAKKATRGYTVSDGSGQYSEETNFLWDEVQDSDTDTETVSSLRVDYPTSGQYSDETNSFWDEAQGPDTFTRSSFRMDYPTKYEASVRELYSMLMELDKDLCESPNNECSETSRLETEQIIRVLKQATDLVSSTGTNWMGHAAETNSYRAEWETLQTARKELNVVSIQRRASAMLQQLRRACRKDDHTRHEPLRFNARADTFSDPIDELFFGNGQASKCDPLMDEPEQHDAVQTQYDAPKRQAKRAVFTEHWNPDSGQHTHDDLWLDASSTNSHRTLQSDATVIQFQIPDSCLRREQVIEDWRAGPPDKMASKGRMASISSTHRASGIGEHRASVNAAKDPQLEVADVNNNFTDVSDSPAARTCRHNSNAKHHICFCLERIKNGRQTSKTYSAKLAPVYEDLKEVPSDSEEEDNVPDQNVEGSEGFDDDPKNTQTKNTGTYTIHSNKENGSHRTTLLECVKVTVGHPTDKNQQCETVLLLDRASDHTYFKQSLCEKLHRPNLGPTRLSVATFLSSDEIPVDTFISQLRIRKSNGKTICIKAPVMPDQFTGKMRTAFVRPEHIKELRHGSYAVCPSTETPEILVGRDLRHLFEVVEEHKPLPSGFLLAHSNIGTMLVGSGRADKPADESELSHHRLFFIQGSSPAESDGVSIGQLLDQPLSDDHLARDVLSSLRDQFKERESHKVLHVSEHVADQKLANLLLQMHSLEQMGVEPPSHLDEDDAVHQRIRECELDYTKKAVVRDENGVVQTVNGHPLESRDLEALRQHQYPVFEKQLNVVVKRLRKMDGDYYPVVLHLRNHNDQQTDVHADAIEIMRRVGMPRDYPIHCHYWTGGRTHYENCTSHFPNTLFGFNAGSFSRGLSPDQLDLLRTIPLDQVTFESDAPYHGRRGTSQTIGTPAGVVRAITQFQELGNRPDDLQKIAQASMANVIRMYLLDLTAITEKPDEDSAHESQTSPSDQTYRISLNSTTTFELTAICDAGCDGPHRQCADVYLVKGPDDEGLILSDRWIRAVRNLHVTTNLRNERVTSFVQIVLCLWGGRLLQDRPQEMVQFFQELLNHPPDQSSDVLSRWYSHITGGSAKKFRAIQASDVRIALRKRFHACSLARGWMQTSATPFQYEFPQDPDAGASEAATMLQSITQLMPEALSWTYDQFVQTTVTVGNDDPDQLGPSRQAQRPTSSRQAQRPTSSNPTSSRQAERPTSSSRQAQRPTSSNPTSSRQAQRPTSSLRQAQRPTSSNRGIEPSQTSRLGIKKPHWSRFKRSQRPDPSKQLIQKMIDLFIETTGTSGQGQRRRREQLKRPHRDVDE